MIKCLLHFLRSQEGTTAIEYGLVLLIISIVAIASMIALGASVDGFFQSASGGLR